MRWRVHAYIRYLYGYALIKEAVFFFFFSFLYLARLDYPANIILSVRNIIPLLYDIIAGPTRLQYAVIIIAIVGRKPEVASG